MRDPVLHIKLSKLEEVFRQLGVDAGLAFVTLEKATVQKFQLRREYVVTAPNSRIQKKLKKSIEAEADVTEKFNMILTAVHQQRQLKNIPLIYKDGKNYILLKEVARLAHEYTINFQFSPPEDGYKKFCEVAMELMGRKYKIEKIKYYAPQIWELTECLLLVDNDVNKAGTQEFYQLWKSVASRYSTAQIDITQRTDWLHILYARDEADQCNAKYEDWITAQFEELAFMSVIPELNQMYGLNARRRYGKYAANKGYKKVGETVVAPRERDPNQKAYWDMIEAGKAKRGEKI